MNITGIIWSVFIWTGISLNLFGQKVVPETTLAIADSLHSAQQYRGAVKEYQRYLFYSGDENPEVLLKLAYGLYEEGDHGLALQYYEQVYFLTDDPEIRFACRIKEIQHSVNLRQYNKALVSLFSIEPETRAIYPDLIHLFTAIAYFGLDDYEKSRDSFLKIVEGDPLAEKEIAGLFSDPRRFHKPNPNTIGIISLFIPGLGQMISGDVKEGLNSLLLVGGIGTGMVIVALRYSLLDALLTLVPWYQRYLLGGSDKAEEIARLKRAENRNEVFQEVLIVLEPYRNKLTVPDLSSGK